MDKCKEKEKQVNNEGNQIAIKIMWMTNKGNI